MTVYVLPKWAKTDLPKYDVTSGGSIFRSLSPFFLGPVHLYDGHVSKNVENGWQYSKWYPHHTEETYWPWAKAGWESVRAHRYPMGKGAPKPLFSLWRGEKLGYVDARRKIYAPLYASAVRDGAWQQLNMLKDFAQQGDIALTDFDAYDHRALGYSWNDVMHDPSRKMGHGFVLAMMIEGVI